MQGGGWCNTIESCSWRKGTPLGSSKYMDGRVPFPGYFNLPQLICQNPIFNQLIDEFQINFWSII
ncbi:hypothetical protein ACE6H2_021501 [Prunus campanulata]